MINQFIYELIAVTILNGCFLYAALEVITYDLSPNTSRGLGSNGTENRVKGSRQGPVDHVSAVLHLAQHSDIG